MNADLQTVQLDAASLGLPGRYRTDEDAIAQGKLFASNSRTKLTQGLQRTVEMVRELQDIRGADSFDVLRLLECAGVRSGIVSPSSCNKLAEALVKTGILQVAPGFEGWRACCRYRAEQGPRAEDVDVAMQEVLKASATAEQAEAKRSKRSHEEGEAGLQAPEPAARVEVPLVEPLAPAVRTGVVTTAGGVDLADLGLFVDLGAKARARKVEAPEQAGTSSGHQLLQQVNKAAAAAAAAAANIPAMRAPEEDNEGEEGRGVGEADEEVIVLEDEEDESEGEEDEDRPAPEPARKRARREGTSARLGAWGRPTALHAEVLEFAARCDRGPEAAQRVQQMVEEVSAAARIVWGNRACAVLFGSQATGLALPGSDLDVVILGCSVQMSNPAKGYNK